MLSLLLCIQGYTVSTDYASPFARCHVQAHGIDHINDFINKLIESAVKQAKKPLLMKDQVNTFTIQDTRYMKKHMYSKGISFDISRTQEDHSHL